MAKLKITKEDKDEFKNTSNGAKKAIWMIVGMVIDFTATLGISLLNIFSSKLPNLIAYYGLLFVLLVIVVLGGELIGIYYGALEQYVFHKKGDSNMNEVNTNNINTSTEENHSGKKVLGIDE